MGAKRKESPSEWLSRQPVKTPIQDWIGASEPPRRSPEEEAALSAERERLSEERRQQAPSEEEVTAAGEDPRAQEPSILSLLLTWRNAFLLGVTWLITREMASANPVKTSLRFLLVYVGAWVLLSILETIWAARAQILAVFGIVTAVVGGAAVTQSHCLHPIESGDEPICILTSLATPDLEPLPPAGLYDLSGAGPFVSWPPTGTGAPPLLRAPARLAGLDAQAQDERAAINACIAQLYEDPAEQYKAWAIRRWNMDLDRAHDVVIDTLLAVCAYASRNEITDPVPYFRRATRNRISDMGRTSRRDDALKSWEWQRRCWSDPDDLFFTEDYVLLQGAIERLQPRYRAVVEVWKTGATWKEAGARLGMTAKEAANTYQYALRLLRQDLESKVCVNAL